MTAVDIALPRLQTEEGFRASVYKDTQGHQSIGFGFDVDAGISRFAASALLVAQATETHQALLKFNWYADLNDARQSVCLDVAFNSGLHGLLNFPHMIAALSEKDWDSAANECKVTNPELASRYKVLAEILLTGIA